MDMRTEKKNIDIGLICVGQQGERMDLAEDFPRRARAALAGIGLKVVKPKDRCTTTEDEVQAQTARCEEMGAVVVLYMTAHGYWPIMW